jgi:hypothetical protein
MVGRWTVWPWRGRRSTAIAVPVAFLILAGTAAALSGRTVGRPVSQGTWQYQGQFGVQGTTYSNTQFAVMNLKSLPGGRTAVRFMDLAGQVLGSCTGGDYRTGNSMDFFALNAQATVGANGRFSISRRSNGSLGPGTMKIAGRFIGTNGLRWAATVEVTQHQVGHGTCTAKRELRATRREQIA